VVAQAVKTARIVFAFEIGRELSEQGGGALELFQGFPDAGQCAVPP